MVWHCNAGPFYWIGAFISIFSEDRAPAFMAGRPECHMNILPNLRFSRASSGDFEDALHDHYVSQLLRVRVWKCGQRWIANLHCRFIYETGGFELGCMTYRPIDQRVFGDIVFFGS